eukprot:1157349-Pelagomonas_calceolata.AAC.5
MDHMSHLSKKNGTNGQKPVKSQEGVPGQEEYYMAPPIPNKQVIGHPEWQGIKSALCSMCKLVNEEYAFMCCSIDDLAIIWTAALTGSLHMHGRKTITVPPGAWHSHPKPQRLCQRCLKKGRETQGVTPKTIFQYIGVIGITCPQNQFMARRRYQVAQEFAVRALVHGSEAILQKNEVAVSWLHQASQKLVVASKVKAVTSTLKAS